MIRATHVFWFGFGPQRDHDDLPALRLQINHDCPGFEKLVVRQDVSGPERNSSKHIYVFGPWALSHIGRKGPTVPLSRWENVLFYHSSPSVVEQSTNAHQCRKVFANAPHLRLISPNVTKQINRCSTNKANAVESRNIHTRVMLSNVVDCLRLNVAKCLQMP